MDDLGLKMRVRNMIMVDRTIYLGSHPKINLDIHIVYGQMQWHG